MRRDDKSGVILPEAALYIHDIEADHWDVHQYWLSSLSPQQFPGRRDLPAGITMSEVQPEWGFARQMYWDVGGPWIWGDRRAYSDHQWQDYVALTGFRQFKLFLKDGALGGYAETSLDPESGIGCLEYFGLLPNAVGQGAGPAFLSQINLYARPSGRVPRVLPERIRPTLESFLHNAQSREGAHNIARRIPNSCKVVGLDA